MEALEYHKTCLQLAIDLQNVCEQASAHGNLGIAYQALKQYEEAKKHHLANIEMAQKGEDLENLCKAYENLGGVYQLLYEHCLAADAYSNQLHIAEQISNDPLQALACGHLGDVYDRLGNTKDSIDFYKKGLRLPCAAPQKVGMLSGLGKVYVHTGEFQKALGCCDIMLKLTAETDQTVKQYAYTRFGDICVSIGKYPQALNYYQHCLAIAEELGDLKGIQSALGNLGTVCLHTCEYAEATQYYQASLEKTKQPGSEMNRAVNYNNLGIAYRRLKEYESSLHSHMSSLELAQKLGNQKLQGDIFGNLGIIAQLRGENEMALQYYTDCLKIAQATNNLNGQGIEHTKIGIVSADLGMFSDAEKHLLQAIENFSTIQKSRLGDVQSKITIFEHQAKASIALENLYWFQEKSEAALEITDSRRARALTQNIATAGEIDAPFLSVDQMKKLAAKQNTIFVVYSSARNLKRIKDFSTRFWIIAPSGEIICDQLSTPEMLSTESSSFDSFPYQTKGASQSLPSTDNDFLQLAKDLIEDEAKGSYAERRREKAQELEGKRAAFSKQLCAWHEALVAPIEKYLSKDQNDSVTFVPDSALATLPFALFQDGEGKYLIEKHPISIAPSVRTLALLAQKQENVTTLPQWSTVVSMPENPGVPSIKSSKEETQEVQKLFSTIGNTALLSKEQATVSNFVEKAKDSRFLHIDCHGKAELKFDPYSAYEGGSTLLRKLVKWLCHLLNQGAYMRKMFPKQRLMLSLSF